MNDIPIRCKANHHVLKKGPSNLRITEAEALNIEYHTNAEDSFERMKDAGFVVFKNLLNEDEVQELRDLMDATGGDDEDHYKPGNYLKKEGDPNFRRYDKHIGNPQCFDKTFLKYVNRQPAIDVIKTIHGYGTRHIGGSIWVTGSGRHPMSLHIDYQPFGLPEDIASDPRVQVPIMISTLHYYLNDMYMDLGPTLVVEGSHKSGRVPNDDTSWNGNKVKALVCKAGDAMLFRSDLWHGALPNNSDERRYMLQVHYGCAYIERTMDSPWSKRRPLPQDAIDACDDQQRRLFGERQKGYHTPQGSYVLKQGLQYKGTDQWHQK